MNIQRDEVDSFIPDDPKFIILGTMVALNARTINGKKPEGDFFYYNDNRNHFWKILQHIWEPESEPIKMSISQKKDFLKKHRIGIQNLVYEIQTPRHHKLDPSDTVLFDCYRKNKIKYKKIPKSLHKKFEGSYFFFTCRHKKGIQELLEGFISHNKFSKDLIERTHFLKTPTRCNPYKRSQEWLSEMTDFCDNFNNV